jgi:hypothetical protein
VTLDEQSRQKNDESKKIEDRYDFRAFLSGARRISRGQKERGQPCGVPKTTYGHSK